MNYKLEDFIVECEGTSIMDGLTCRKGEKVIFIRQATIEDILECIGSFLKTSKFNFDRNLYGLITPDGVLRLKKNEFKTVKRDV